MIKHVKQLKTTSNCNSIMWILPEMFKRPGGAMQQVDQEIHQVFIGDNNPIETMPKY